MALSAQRALCVVLLLCLARVATPQVSCAAGNTDCDGAGTGTSCCACAAGKFKTSTGIETCINCPVNTSSAGSALINPAESFRTLTQSWGTRTTSALYSGEGWYIADYYVASVTTAALAVTSQHVQIDLEFPTNVTGFGLQSCTSATSTNRCFTSISVSYSKDAIIFEDAISTSNSTRFTTCTTMQNNNFVENHMFMSAVLGRYVRIRVWSWTGYPCGRVGLFVMKPTHTQAVTCFECTADGTSASGDANGCACPPGSESSGYECFLCPLGKFKSLHGTGRCTTCIAGTYASVSGMTTCLQCSNNSNAPAGATSASSCLCNAGYSGANGGPCTPCIAGTFKTTTGSAPCTVCAAGTYSVNVGATSACINCLANQYSTTVGANTSSTCISCPYNTTSAAGSAALANCVCLAGFTGPNGGTCTPCVEGKFKSTTGSAACSNCAAGTYSVLTASIVCINCLANQYSTAVGANSNTTCINCPNNSSSAAGSGALTSCVCLAGFTGPNGGPCSPCVAGTYKINTGSAACTVCPAFSTSQIASTALARCLCNAGYSGPDGGTCTACGRHTFKRTSGSASCTACSLNMSAIVGSVECAACPVGKYKSTFGTEVCAGCPGNSSSREGIYDAADCFCNNGYTGTAATQTYDFSPYQTLSTFINFGVTSFGASSFTTFLDKSTTQFTQEWGVSRISGNGWIQIKSPGNFTQVQMSYSATFQSYNPTGYVRLYRNNTLIASLLAVSWGHQRRETIIPGDLLKWEETASGIGFDFQIKFLDGCQALPQTLSSSTTLSEPVFEPLTCRACTAGFFVSQETGNCTACPDGSSTHEYTNGSSVVDCMCRPGFEPHVNKSSCILCSVFTHKGTLSNASCSACPANSQTNRTGAVAIDECVCMRGFTQRTVPNASAANASAANASECVACEAGTYKTGLGLGACVPCPINHFCPPASPAPRPCPPNSTSPAGSVSGKACVCGDDLVLFASQDTYTSVDTYKCDVCYADTYYSRNATTSVAVCLPCQNASSSRAGSRSKRDCVCKPGYVVEYADVYSCAACAPGSFSNASNASVCDSCAAGKFSSSFAASACTRCAPGTVALSAGLSACSPCPAATWQDVAAPGSLSSPCVPCPVNSAHELSGVVDVFKCMCATGMYKTRTGNSFECTVCEPGFVCSEGASSVVMTFTLSIPLSEQSFTPELRQEFRDIIALLVQVDRDRVLIDSITATSARRLLHVRRLFSSNIAVEFSIFFESGTNITSIQQPTQEQLNAELASRNMVSVLVLEQPVITVYEQKELCPPESFCAGGEQVFSCRPFSRASLGASSQAECMCEAGYYSPNISAPCMKCPPGSFCLGGVHVQKCPANASSAPGAQAVEDCFCKDGHWRRCTRTHSGAFLNNTGQPCVIDWIAPCVMCGANDICFNDTLLHCPEHSVAQPGSSLPQHCECLPGYAAE